LHKKTSIILYFTLFLLYVTYLRIPMVHLAEVFSDLETVG